MRGSSNLVADALSRNSLNAVQIGIDYKEIAKGQREDTELKRLRQEKSNLKWIEYDVEGLTLICETSTGRSRPYLPPQMRKAVFHQAHNLSHPSSKAMVRILTERYLWADMRADIRKWAKECLPCQKSKVGRHTESGIGSIKRPLTKDWRTFM